MTARDTHMPEETGSPIAPTGPHGAVRATSQWRANFPIVAAALIGLIWSGVATYFVWQWERGIARQELVTAADGHFLALQNGLNEYLNKLSALRTFFQSSDHVGREEFESFATRLLEGQTAVQNFSWVPRITDDERAQHENNARWEGIPGYQIRAVTIDDRIVPSPKQGEYFPINYSTVDRGSRIYGVDLASQPIIRNRLEPARDNNELSAVPEFLLHSQDDDAHGFLFSLPVYRRDMALDTVEQRQAHLIGFVHGAFHTAEAINYILKHGTTPRGLDVYLYLADAAPNSPPLYVHSSRLRSSGLAQQAPRERVELMPHVTSTLEAGDTHWTMVAVAAPGGPLATQHDRAWLVLFASLFSSAGAVLYLRSSMRHAQRLMQANGEIMTLAQRDSLTGLFNRREFNARLAALFDDDRSGRAPFAVLYFDLDHFKDVNDTMGHPIGDRLLKQAAERVQSVLRQSDVLARFGGDEFAVIVNADAAVAADVAARINEILARPFMVDGNDVHITASIGIALYTADTATPETLVMHADVALYRAKEDGRNCARFHSVDLDHEVHERVAIADDLRNAARKGELRLHFQPQVELQSGRITGVEALLRWQHPKRGLLVPPSFIGIAERTGSIAAIGEWAFDEACRQMRSWLDRGIAPEWIAVNVSASQFRTGAVFERSIVESLRRWRVDPALVEIELTESVLMEVNRHDDDGLERLRTLGLRIAIDDFGTGYSSLSYLTNYTVNRLKIAQELVFGVMKDSRNAAVVRTAIRLADDLGIDCLAEGVENASQVKFLVAAGCYHGQGYHFSRPLCADRMTEALTKRAAGRRRKPPRLELVAG